MNDIVLLLRDHPGLRDHHAAAKCQRLVDRMRIIAEFELTFCETKGCRQRAGLFNRAMAILAHPLIDRFASFQRGIIPIGDHAPMIQVGFVSRHAETE